MISSTSFSPRRREAFGRKLDLIRWSSGRDLYDMLSAKLDLLHAAKALAGAGDCLPAVLGLGVQVEAINLFEVRGGGDALHIPNSVHGRFLKWWCLDSLFS